MSYKISIIIPIFNVPPQVFESCVYSIANQTDNREIELIIVDDGSEGDCSKEYQRIIFRYFANGRIIVNERNRGVSFSRNRGIEESSGDYCMFVDADDYILCSFIEEGRRLAEKYSPDIIIGGISDCNRKGRLVQHTILLDNNSVSQLKLMQIGEKCKTNYNRRMSVFFGSPCGKLYKREIIKNIQFDERLTHLEDQVFNRLVFLNVQNAIISSNVWYFYRERESSAMHAGNTPELFIRNMVPFIREWNNLDRDESDIDIKRSFRRYSLSFLPWIVTGGVISTERSVMQKIKMIHRILSWSIFEEIMNGVVISDLSMKSRLIVFAIKHRTLGTVLLYLALTLKTVFEVAKNNEMIKRPMEIE